jgi:hypothetical protein
MVRTKIPLIIIYSNTKHHIRLPIIEFSRVLAKINYD